MAQRKEEGGHGGEGALGLREKRGEMGKEGGTRGGEEGGVGAGISTRCISLRVIVSLSNEMRLNTRAQPFSPGPSSSFLMAKFQASAIQGSGEAFRSYWTADIAWSQIVWWRRHGAKNVAF